LGLAGASAREEERGLPLTQKFKRILSLESNYHRLHDFAFFVASIYSEKRFLMSWTINKFAERQHTSGGNKRNRDGAAAIGFETHRRFGVRLEKSPGQNKQS
jgi:hypothetical protein